MNSAAWILVLVFLWILLATHQTFWVIVAGLLLLAYFITIASKATVRGAGKAKKKIKDVYLGEMKELDGVTGKYPAKFFDSVGKGAAEKLGEHLAPPGAKSYKQGESMKWQIKKPMDKVYDSANKILDSLSKLFSK